MILGQNSNHRHLAKTLGYTQNRTNSFVKTLTFLVWNSIWISNFIVEIKNFHSWFIHFNFLTLVSVFLHTFSGKSWIEFVIKVNFRRVKIKWKGIVLEGGFLNYEFSIIRLIHGKNELTWLNQVKNKSIKVESLRFWWKLWRIYWNFIINWWWEIVS